MSVDGPAPVQIMRLRIRMKSVAIEDQALRFVSIHRHRIACTHCAAMSANRTRLPAIATWPRLDDDRHGALNRQVRLDGQLSAGILPTPVDRYTHSAVNWWDADFNAIAARVPLATREPHRLIHTWSEHAVVRMFERCIRVDQVATALHTSRHGDSRDPLWIRIQEEGNCCHIGANDVKVWVDFRDGVHRIATVAHTCMPDVGDAESYVSTSFEHRMKTVVERSKAVASVLVGEGDFAAGDLSSLDVARPHGCARRGHADGTVARGAGLAVEEPDATEHVPTGLPSRQTRSWYVFRPEHQRGPLVAGSWEVAERFWLNNPELPFPQAFTTFNDAVANVMTDFPTVADSGYILAV